MRTDLDHLPPAKQRELERVVQILFEEFGDATAIATSDWNPRTRREDRVRLKVCGGDNGRSA